MEFVGPICEALRCLGDPTCTYIEHHRKLEDRMNDLLAKQRQLNAMKRDVELRKNSELRWGRLLRQEVENWLQDVQTVNGKIQNVDERMQNASCFSRGRLGKQVSQTVEQVKEIIEQGRFTGALVIDDPSAAGVPFQLEDLEGETAVIADIRKHLMSDEIGMVGVCGMGGIGKTTIMKHIYNQLLEETKSKPMFEKIIWVTVSQDFNITRLQEDIADAMNIEDLPKSEQKRAAVLRNKLRQIRHVLILDDVWEGFVLEKVGIPEPISSNRSKLVLTSRLKEFCKSIGCHEIVEVPLLSDEESMNLFLVHTGHEVLKVPSLEEILGEIVRECDRLPLAIKVIASSMKGINDVVEWRNALTELRNHVTSVKDTDKEIYGRLKFSFDRLKDSNIQNCFLYCSLYPEDYRIPRVELIEYWIDEGFLEMGSRQQLHDRGHTILNRLINNCLLEKAGDDVKMHDVMRDMALYIKHLHFIVKAGTGLKELPSKLEWKKDVERASFMMNKVSEIPLSLSPNCGNLSTLLLKKNMSLKRISESFFQHMHSLSIFDLSYTGIEQLPNSVSNLETLNALVLRGCYKLRYVPSLEKLEALRKLDLRGTGIEKVPTGLEMLTNLTYLNLCTESLKELPIAILPRLSCLQCLVLYVKSACVKMNGLELARLSKLEVFEGRFNELLDFNAYTTSIQGRQLTSYLLVMAPLGECIDYVFRFNSNRCCDGCEFRLRKSLSKFPAVKTVSFTGEKKTIVEATLEVSGKLEMGPTNIAARLTKRRLEVQLMDEWWEPPILPMKNVILSGCPIGREDPAELPSDVRSLRIFRCHNIRSLSDLPFFQRTNELGFCSIHDCRGIESVLDLSSQSQSCTPFENLELLRLENLDNLNVLVKVAEAYVVSTLSSQSIPAIFSHLKSFHIEGCSNMKQLFPFDLVHDLQNLENLIVRGCGQIEEIIGPKEEAEDHKGNGTQAPTKFSLSKLKELELTCLPELKSICSSNREMVCNSLRKIKVWDCTKLKRMPLCLPHFLDTHQAAPSVRPFVSVLAHPKEWWESVEWDYPNAKEVLRPWLNFY
ncbi:hypothetical protein ES332_D01G047100v1 [Gossypium tomentosum]|uniref:Uncharacterized protein n=1 Tax=Gossypium tomentosum TaxID=34277 RepID=A0A5D2M5D0_GOSTO|nr:hypothetical protein ES332_D01G047100v1 [Gossypium tomentosum]TYH86494.1 hypothetical protein ES332_D01G047100v1 [Gossypium tomentosum]TYH86495.1 hypothetical protein ES332_D01G047100v1 [Gossypium tomentosum]TYH86496.1 hypothetical protein ES332_D01G047100v1 [Gossypium tomentosum]